MPGVEVTSDEEAGIIDQLEAEQRPISNLDKALLTPRATVHGT